MKARRPRRPPPLKVAIDGSGTPLSFTPEQVDHVVKGLMATGELVMVVFRKGSDLGCLVLGDPDPMLPAVLETTAAAYRKALQTEPQKGN